MRATELLHSGVVPKEMTIWTIREDRHLEDSCAHGYQIATGDASPISRPIVTRYGSKEYAKSYLYAWMPVIDVKVIRPLIPTE